MYDSSYACTNNLCAHDRSRVMHFSKLVAEEGGGRVQPEESATVYGGSTLQSRTTTGESAQKLRYMLFNLFAPAVSENIIGVTKQSAANPREGGATAAAVEATEEVKTEVLFAFKRNSQSSRQIEIEHEASIEWRTEDNNQTISGLIATKENVERIVKWAHACGKPMRAN